MGKRLDSLYNIGQEIYSQSTYKWDGSSRPILDDYISPWSKYANYEEANSIYAKARHYNNAIRYAKTQMEAGAAQYEQDLAFWNERDERNYTSPSAQTQRFEDAGYNLGYMYGSVDSGNSAVGYNQGSTSLDPNDTSNKSMEQVKQVAEVVSGAFSLVTQLVKDGFDIKLIDERTALTQWQKAESIARGTAISLQSQWAEILRTTTPEGDTTQTFTESIAFLSEKLGYDIKSNEFSRLSTFLKYCDQLYKNQSTDMVKELFGDINDTIKDIDSKGIQSLLRFLSVMAVSIAQKL